MTFYCMLTYIRNIGAQFLYLKLHPVMFNARHCLGPLAYPDY